MSLLTVFYDYNFSNIQNVKSHFEYKALFLFCFSLAEPTEQWQ